MKTFAFINKSTRVTDAQVAIIASAAAMFLALQLCPAYGLTVPSVVACTDATMPPDATPFYFFDTSDVADALGYHDETPQGKAYAKVFVGTTLDNGGTVMVGALSVSGCAIHELAETVINEHVNSWEDDSNGKEWIKEVCDWVENDPGNSVDVLQADGSTVNVALSNFVWPAAFDPHTPPGTQLDQMGTLTAPFSITSGGYATYRTASVDEQQNFGDKMVHETVWGREYPAWKKEEKKGKLSRVARAIALSEAE